jgi:hypothetical protein
LPDHRLLVVHEKYWTAFYKRHKHVEFRVDTTLEEGMSVLFAMGAAQRRSGLTDLLLAEVREVCRIPIAEASRRFPKEAKACDLSARWDSPTVACIVVRNVRLAPHFVMLGPGNLGALRQFSHKHCRPQFCLITDLGKTVTVEHKGKAVQRRLISTAPCIQSSRGGKAVSPPPPATAAAAAAAAAAVAAAVSPPTQAGGGGGGGGGGGAPRTR